MMNRKAAEGGRAPRRPNPKLRLRIRRASTRCGRRWQRPDDVAMQQRPFPRTKTMHSLTSHRCSRVRVERRGEGCLLWGPLFIF